ncbi:MAG: MFS transporter [Alphaproteobacteria bacterium]|nr:MFS transporter [Alphaproteobacteria bacterium]
MSTTREYTPEQLARVSGNYKWFALGILFMVYVFNFVDRQIFGILQQSIKEDLGLSDTQLGLLGGFAFALFYTTFGIPLAWLADRANRSKIIAVCLAVWSLMTILCGRANSFWTLALARIGVGVGEAGCSPPAHSMISDYFAPAQRGTALAIYSLGISVGVMFGYFAGGWINQLYDWRTAFLAVGLPGVVFAVFVLLFLREPPRGMAEGRVEEIRATKAPTMLSVFKMLWGRRSFRWLSIAAALHAFVSYGNQFIPPFFERSHGFETGPLSTWLGLITGIAGGLGIFLGGYFSDKLGAKDRRWMAWLPAWAMIIALPIGLAAYLVPNGNLALILLILPTILNYSYNAPTFAMTQGLVAPRMRAVAVAVLFFILNLIGLGLGPVFVGALSDALMPSLGQESMRWALVATGFINVISAICYFQAARFLREDMAAADRGE